jgi:lysophospholipase L1-like esterase
MADLLSVFIRVCPWRKKTIFSRRFAIVFLCIIVIIAGCGTKVSEEAKAIKILTFGDSITEGVRYGVSKHETYTFYLGQLLKGSGFQVEMIREGVSGEDTDGALRRIERDVIQRKPDYVVIMYGTNDAFMDVQNDETDTTPRIPLERYEENLRTMIRMLRENRIAPVLMTTIPMGEFDILDLGIYGENDNNFKLKEYVEAVRRIAGEENLLLVDHFKRWSRLRELGKDINTLMTDGLHPNPEGNLIIAKSILKVLKEELVSERL